MVDLNEKIKGHRTRYCKSESPNDATADMAPSEKSALLKSA